MTNEERKTEVIAGILMMVLLPLSIFVEGLVLAYGWNTFLTTIWAGLPRLGWAQAFGLTTVTHLILPEGFSDKDEKLTTTLAKMIAKPAIVILALWLVHFAL